MVAYSFRGRFVDLIEAGFKRQTIRAERKRHARPGEQLQLYTAMRTRSCRLLGRARCSRVGAIRLDFAENRIETELTTRPFEGDELLQVFARSDGFLDWEEMKQFWREEHGAMPAFSGVLITWREFLPDSGVA
jgi:hypothetical protein